MLLLLLASCLLPVTTELTAPRSFLTEKLVLSGDLKGAERLLASELQATSSVDLNNLGVVRYLLSGDTEEVHVLSDWIPTSLSS